MSHTKSIFLVLLGTAILITGMLFGFVTIAHANPEGFLLKPPQSSNGTLTATTSPSYMTPGTATTTYSFDTSAGNVFAASNQAALLVQYTASSTLSALQWRYEYSQDTTCGTSPTTADWYAQNDVSYTNQTATTSPYGIQSGPFEYRWNYASSTPGAAAVATNQNLGKKVIMVPIPTRCVRVMFYVPIGASNGAVWAEWVAKKEVQ